VLRLVEELRHSLQLVNLVRVQSLLGYLSDGDDYCAELGLLSGEVQYFAIALAVNDVSHFKVLLLPH